MGNYEVVTQHNTARKIERGYLPGFNQVKLSELAEKDQRVALPDESVLWQGGWLDAGKALADQVEAGLVDVGFAVLDQDTLWDSRGKFMQVYSPWECFDYKHYVRVAVNVFGKTVIALFERQY